MSRNAVTAETPLHHLEWSAISGEVSGLMRDAVLAQHFQYRGGAALGAAHDGIMEGMRSLAALLGHRLEPIYAPGSVMLDPPVIALRPVVLEDFSVSGAVVRTEG